MQLPPFSIANGKFQLVNYKLSGDDNLIITCLISFLFFYGLHFNVIFNRKNRIGNVSIRQLTSTNLKEVRC